MTPEEHDDPATHIAPRYWIAREEVDCRLTKKDKVGNVIWEWNRDWLLSFRNVSRANNDRTLVASVVPRVSVGHSAPLLFINKETRDSSARLLAALSSFCCDYIARQKVGGIYMTFGYFCQFAVPSEKSLNETCRWNHTKNTADWIAPRVLELTYTAHDLTGFARDLGYTGPPFRWNETRRARIRAELDAAFFLLYGVSRDDADYILDTFTVFKKRDEQRNEGVYKTKETILTIFDEMAKSIASDKPWVSSLDPTPGPPTDAEGSFIPMAEWDEWPPHIHPATETDE